MQFAADQCGLLASELRGASGRTPGCHWGQELWVRVCLHAAWKLPKIYSSQRVMTKLNLFNKQSISFCFQHDRAELHQNSGVSAVVWALAERVHQCLVLLGAKGSWGVLQAKWVPWESNTCSVQILHQQSPLGKGECWREVEDNHFITDFISS